MSVDPSSAECAKFPLFGISVDLWALGCTVYQMLEGRPPFKAATEYLIFQKVMARELSMPSHFSPEAKDLVERLLVRIQCNWVSSSIVNLFHGKRQRMMDSFFIIDPGFSFCSINDHVLKNKIDFYVLSANGSS